jgi:hypothetical protein
MIRACPLCLPAALLLALAAVGCSGAETEPVIVTISIPHGEGSTWRYEITPPTGAAYTQTQTVLESSATAYKKKIVDTSSSATYEVNDFTVGSTGIFRTGFTVHSKASDEVSSTCTYAPPELVVPLNAAAGDSRTTDSTFTVQGTGSTFTDHVTNVVTVDGAERVTVPAGTFSAAKVTAAFTRTSGGARTTTVVTRWYANGVGWVKAVAYPADDPAAITTSLLASYALK